MNAYDFVKINGEYTRNVKIPAYDRDMVAKLAEFEGYKNADYEAATDAFIDVTMSCCEDEALEWMKYFMDKAVGYGIKTKNQDWRTKYLAAYDLFNRIAVA